jgi:hypothetical protein
MPQLATAPMNASNDVNTASTTVELTSITGGVLSSTGAAAVLVQTFMPALLMQGGRQDVPPRTRDRYVPIIPIRNFLIYYKMLMLQ